MLKNSGLEELMPHKNSARTGADLIVEYLEQEGVEFVFGVPGAPLNALYRRLHQSSIRTILAKHESGAAFMAYGYARATNKVGVCLGTAGPGATNLVTGIATAKWDGVPMLALTGQVPTDMFGKGALQEATAETFNVISIMSPVAKYADQVPSALLVGRAIRKALRTVFSGQRGPAVLSLPADILSGEVDEAPAPLDDYRVASRPFDRMMLQRVVSRLLEARHPVILAGSGVVASRGTRELFQLSSDLGIPVATTQSGKGAFPESHELSLGVYGFAGTPRAQQMVEQHSDLVVVVGSSLGQLQTGNFSEGLRRPSLIHIDISQDRIGRTLKPEIGLVGDAQVVFKELLFHIRRDWRAEHEGRRQERLRFMEGFREKVPAVSDEEPCTSSQTPLLPQRLIHELQGKLPEDALVFWDSGGHAIWGLHYFRAEHPTHFIHSGTFAPMGLSIAAAIGAGLALPDRRMICVTGDGCFMMHGLEVATAVNYQVPIIWIVMNNSGMRMVENGQKQLFGEAYDWSFRRVDFARLARSLGAQGYRVRRPRDLERILDRCFKEKQPAVIDCWIDPAALPPARTNSNASR